MPKEDTQFNSETGRLAAQRSTEVRRAKRSMREDMKWILSLPINDAAITSYEDMTSYSAIQNSNPTVQVAVLGGIAKRAAAAGDPNAAKLIREIVGSEDVKQGTGHDYELANLITELFYTTAHYELITRRHRDLWLKGGRGSTKSSWAAKRADDAEERIKEETFGTYSE